MRYKRHAANAGASLLLIALGYLAFLFAVAAIPGWLVYFSDGMLDLPRTQLMFDTLWRTLAFWLLAYVMYSIENARRQIVR